MKTARGIGEVDGSGLEQFATMDARIVVAGVDADGVGGVLPELVGLMLHPTRELIVGAVKGSPAEIAMVHRGEAWIEEMVGARFTTPEEREALHDGYVLPVTPRFGVADGAARRRALS